MRVTTDIEAGNGRNIRELAPCHFAMETLGQGSSYAEYFCFQIENAEHRDALCRVDVQLDRGFKYPDDYKDRFCKTRYPLWMCSPDAVKSTTEYSGSDWTFHLNVPVPANSIISVSPMIVLPFAKMSEWLRKCNSDHPSAKLHKIGKSVQGRDISLLSIGKSIDKPHILVVSGMHGIEFPGIWASYGIIEFLLSPDAAAHKILDNFVVDVLMYANPDGTLSGQPRTNALGVDVYRQSRRGQSDAPEVEALWQWIDKHPPVIYINLHGWCACERGFEPYEGAIRAASQLFKPHGLLDTVHRCDQLLTKYANPISRYEAIVEFGVTYDPEPDNMLNQLAQLYGTIGYTYEPNMRTGADGCRQKGIKVLRALSDAFVG